MYIAYHDTERGVPVHDERKHFEMLALESQQAWLTRLTILKRREWYRAAFDNFDPEKVAQYDEDKIEELMQNPALIRNRRKIQAIVTNAQKFLDLQSEYWSFDSYIRSWTQGKTIAAEHDSSGERVVSSVLSDRIARDMKSRGFSFVGTIVVYAWLQAIGIIAGHQDSCDRK